MIPDAWQRAVYMEMKRDLNSSNAAIGHFPREEVKGFSILFQHYTSHCVINRRSTLFPVKEVDASDMSIKLMFKVSSNFTMTKKNKHKTIHH